MDWQSGYSLETIPVSFDELTYFFTKVSNPGDVAVDLDSQGELLWQPYWAEDWESSRALCRLLLNRAIQGISILDLGCGLGLTGAVAASRGAKVILADNARPALEFSEINCWKWNHLCSYREVDWKANQSELKTGRPDRRRGNHLRLGRLDRSGTILASTPETRRTSLAVRSFSANR